MSDGLRTTFVVGFLSLTLGPVIGGGIIANRDLHARAVAEANEHDFRDACVSYKEASTWQRWTTPMGWSDSWCEDYLHRM